MFEAIAHWYLQKKQERRALMEPLANTPAGPPPMGGLAQLNRDRYGDQRHAQARNMMIRVVAIRNGYLVGADNDPFEDMEFCKDAAEVAMVVTTRTAGFILEK